MGQETPKGSSQHEQGGRRETTSPQSGQTGQGRSGQQSGQAGQQNVKSGPSKCEACGKSFNSESELREHEKTHKAQQQTGQSTGQGKH